MTELVSFSVVDWNTDLGECARALINEILFVPYGAEASFFTEKRDEDHDALYVVAEAEDVIGAARVLMNPPWAYLENSGLMGELRRQGADLSVDELISATAFGQGIGVSPDYRKSNFPGVHIARELAERRLSVASNRDKIYFVQKSRPMAVSLADSLGFVPIGSQLLELPDDEITLKCYYRNLTVDVSETVPASLEAVEA